MFGIGTQEMMIFLVIAMVLFGSARLPTLMRNLGRSATEFKKGMREEDEDTSETDDIKKNKKGMREEDADTSETDDIKKR